MTCAICRAPIFLATITVTGTRIPVDLKPYTGGKKGQHHRHNILLLDRPHCEVVTGTRRDQLIDRRHPLYLAHYVTCTDPDAWRRPASVHPDLAQQGSPA